MRKAKLVVTLPDNTTYDVRVGSGLIDTIGQQLRSYEKTAKATKVFLLVDANVAPYYLERVKAALGQALYSVVDVTVPAGEDAKTPEVLLEVWRAMAQCKLDRGCLVLALGGGAVCDLAGFVAATYMRGVTCAYIPTTVLSMVDASVGGKTAVNLPEGKNLVGAFSQPAYVCSDLETLNTLPEREWASGFAEVAKSAVLESDDFFFWMMDHAEALMAHEEEAVCEAVVRSVSFKANVVAQDVTERLGVRECLNYGHTYGHAVEVLAGYGTYAHGAGVAEGMRFAGLLAQLKGLVEEETVDAQNRLLDTLGLPKLDWGADPQAVLDAMKGDKKTHAGQVRFVLPHDIGNWDVVPLPDEEILSCLEVF